MPDNTVNKGNSYATSFKDSFLDVAKTTATGAGVGLAAGTAFSYLPFIGKKYRVGVTADTFVNAVRTGNDAILPQTKELPALVEKVKEYLSHEASYLKTEKLTFIDDALAQEAPKNMANVKKLLSEILPKGTEIPVDDDKIAGFVKEQLKNDKPFDEIRATVAKIGGEISEGVSNALENIKNIKPKDIKALKGTPDFEIMQNAKKFYRTMKSAAKDVARGPIIACTVCAGILAALTSAFFAARSSSKKAVANSISGQADGQIQSSSVTNAAPQKA